MQVHTYTHTHKHKHVGTYIYTGSGSACGPSASGIAYRHYAQAHVQVTRMYAYTQGVTVRVASLPLAVRVG